MQSKGKQNMTAAQKKKYAEGNSSGDGGCEDTNYAEGGEVCDDNGGCYSGSGDGCDDGGNGGGDCGGDCGGDGGGGDGGGD